MIRVLEHYYYLLHVFNLTLSIFNCKSKWRESANLGQEEEFQELSFWNLKFPRLENIPAGRVSICIGSRSSPRLQIKTCIAVHPHQYQF